MRSYYTLTDSTADAVPFPQTFAGRFETRSKAEYACRALNYVDDRGLVWSVVKVKVTTLAVDEETQPCA